MRAMNKNAILNTMTGPRGRISRVTAAEGRRSKDLQLKRQHAEDQNRPSESRLLEHVD